MKRSTLPWSGRRLATRGVAAALATATAATLAGMAVTPAQSAMDLTCPEAFPIDELEDGAPVEGLTVVKGTEPAPFTGEVLGVLQDGIMPGMDMIMVRLGKDGGTGSDQRIYDVGIWSGMSGSPVYAADGRLIGAVAYGLSFGASTVAGVTPAEDMRALVESGSDPVRMPTKVEVPERIEDRIVAEGDATRAEVESDLSQLEVMGLSGLSQRRLDKATKKLEIRGVERMMLGAAGAEDLDANSIVAGGNLAAGISYGDISFTGVGTATLVCGEEVVGFGHPMMWNGPTTLSLHPAEAVYVQEDPTFPGFKVANLGGPVGTIDQDRMAGIAGSFGAIPDASEITSQVTSETGERTGTSWVNVEDWLPDVALFHLLTNEDKVFDGIGKGSGTVGFVVEGTRADGTTFQVTREDVYASEYDLTWETAWDLYMALYRLQGNQIEDLSISAVNTTSDLRRDYAVSTIESVSVKQGGKWVPLGRRLILPAGSTAHFKAELLTTGGAVSTVELELPVRKGEAGRRGWLGVFGGNSADSWFSGRNLPVDKLIERIESAPHNDDVVVNMRLWRERRSERNVNRLGEPVPTGVPVNGYDSTRVIIVGGK